MINIIAACSLDGGIGYKGKIPWYYKQDMMFFKKMTLHKIILMGKNTWFSIPNPPLDDRFNMVLTTKEEEYYYGDDVATFDNFDEPIQRYKEIWVIGGESVYKQAIKHEKFKSLYLTRIIKNYTCDKFFPPIPPEYKKTTINRIIENDTELLFEKYENILYKSY